MAMLNNQMVYTQIDGKRLDFCRYPISRTQFHEGKVTFWIPLVIWTCPNVLCDVICTFPSRR